MSAQEAMDQALQIGEVLSGGMPRERLGYLFTIGIEAGLWIAFERPELASALRDLMASAPAGAIAARQDSVRAIIEAGTAAAP